MNIVHFYMYISLIIRYLRIKPNEAIFCKMDFTEKDNQTNTLYW